MQPLAPLSELLVVLNWVHLTRPFENVTLNRPSALTGNEIIYHFVGP